MSGELTKAGMSTREAALMEAILEATAEQLRALKARIEALEQRKAFSYLGI